MLLRILSVFIFFVATALSDELPKSITPCRRSDPDLSNCIARAIKQGVLAFKDGSEEFDIEALDPIFVPEIDMIQSSSNKNFHLSATFYEMHLKGLSDSKFEDFKVEVTDKQIKIRGKVIIPVMKMDGKYEMHGKILLMNIHSKDNTRQEFINMGGTLELDLDRDDSDGTGYIIVKDAQFKITVMPEKSTIIFDNIVQGNPKLSEEMNKMLQDNFNVLMKLYASSINQFFSSLVQKIAAKLFSSIPMDVALPL